MSTFHIALYLFELAEGIHNLTLETGIEARVNWSTQSWRNKTCIYYLLVLES